MRKTIFISAGHSDTDPGAVAQGRREADIAVEFRNLIAFYLMRDGVPHELDGHGTANLPLAETVKRSSLYDIAIEIHCNAGPPLATGVECLAGQDDIPLAAQLSRAIAQNLAIRDRGAKPEDSGQHTRLAFVRAGGIIVELFFLTNRADLTAYYNRKWLAARPVAEVLTRAAR